MEPRIINSYVFGADLTRPMRLYYDYRRPFVIVVDILSVIWVIWGIVLSVLNKSITPEISSIIGFILCWNLFRVILHFRNLHMDQKRLEVNTGGFPETLTLTVTDTLVLYDVQSSRGSAHYEYRLQDFKRVIVLKELIMMETIAKQVIFFKNDGYLLGSAEELKAFLRSRGFKVK